MTQELAQDPGLVQDYLTECSELLQGLGADLVALESEPNDPDRLNRVFRAVHTIKGTSGFMGFTAVVELTHHAEDILNLVRKGERRVTPRLMDVLLSVHDQLREMMGDIAADRTREYSLRPLLQSLTDLQMGGADSSERPAAVPGTSSSGGGAAASSHATFSSEVRETVRTIRVDVGKLDELINLVGELVLERNRLIQVTRDFEQRRIAPEKFESALSHTSARLSFLTDELQVAGLNTRMVPVDTVFRRFPRLVRDIARALGKEVDLVIVGEDTELDRNLVEEIADPLMHLVRNAVDHGIERPEVRTALGKPRAGTVRLEARQEGDHIVIRVQDDGAGIDPEKLVKKAVEKGLVAPARLALASRTEILDLIFLPGFSTAEQVSDISGRGVGMDVVRSNLKKLNAAIQLESEVGKGSSFILKVPLTLAILPALLVRTGDETYALPLRSIVETVRIASDEIHRLEDGSEIFRLRNAVLPLRRLDSAVGLTGEQQARDTVCVVVLSVGERRAGLIVDQLIGQEETVIKPLGSYLRRIQGVSGCTISGEGRVCLILDPAGLFASLHAIGR